MISQIKIYNPYSNLVVTREYVSIIKDALEFLGLSVVDTQKLEPLEKHKLQGIVVVASKDAIKAKLCGYSPIILWLQGIIPEESYMRHSNKLRRSVLSNIEKRGLQSSDFFFFISDAMRLHYEKKYNFSTSKYYIMPCFNSELNREAFFVDGKYKNNTFLYAGSIDAWQCFEETLEVYKKIEDKAPNAVLRIMTPQQELARELVGKSGIKNCFVGFAPGEKIVEEMKNAKFGFSLRNDHPVNNVSTPTKLSTYVTNGVIPIYSKYVYDFNQKNLNNPFAVSADADNGYSIDKIVKLCNVDIDPEQVWSCFSDTFGSYYSRTFHIENMAAAINQKLQLGGDVKKC